MAGNVNSKPVKDLSILQLSNYCAIHPKNIVKKFCYQHDALLCNDCNSERHNKCDSVVSIEEASRRVRQSFELEDLKSRLNGRKPVLQHSLRTLTLRSDGARIERVCFLPNDKLLLSDIREPYIYITKIDGTETQTIKLQNIPCDVDVIGNHKAIVTFGSKGFQILDLGTLTLGPCINPSGSAAWSLSCSNGQILVVSGGNRIFHITVEGDIKHTYNTKHNPYHIHQCDDGDIYYNALDDNALFKLKSDNNEEEVFFTHPDLRGPRAIGDDGQGNVYIAAYHTNNRHKLHTSSKNHSIILSKDDGINSPYDICYNRYTRQLLVVNEFGRKIDIYYL